MRISDWSSDVCSSDLVALGDAAAARSQVRIALDELVERGDLAGRRRAIAHDRIVDQRDVGRILEDPVTIRVTVDGPGVRQAGMTVVVRGAAGLVVTEQRLLPRSEEHTSELQSLMRISYAVFILTKKHHYIHSTH